MQVVANNDAMSRQVKVLSDLTGQPCCCNTLIGVKHEPIGGLFEDNPAARPFIVLIIAHELCKLSIRGACAAPSIPNLVMPRRECQAVTICFGYRQSTTFRQHMPRAGTVQYEPEDADFGFPDGIWRWQLWVVPSRQRCIKALGPDATVFRRADAKSIRKF